MCGVDPKNCARNACSTLCITASVNPLLPTRTTGSNRCAAAFNLRISGLVNRVAMLCRQNCGHHLMIVALILFNSFS